MPMTKDRTEFVCMMNPGRSGDLRYTVEDVYETGESEDRRDNRGVRNELMHPPQS